MAGEVLIFSESSELMLEMLNIGSTLAEKLEVPLSAAVLVPEAEKLATLYAEHGAQKVYLVEDAPPQYQALEYADALAELMSKNMPIPPEAVLIGSTKFGKELAARLAARLQVGCVTDCISLEVDAASRMLIVERLVYGGNALAKLKFTKCPQLVTIPPRAYEPAKTRPEAAGKAELVRVRIDAKTSAVKTIKVSTPPAAHVRIEDAEVIVSCGRGVKKKEDIQLIRELAEALGGEIGCSRPISADLNWLPKDHWIGLSGHKVKPKLYIACGISGQIQHLAGMRGSQLVVAINKDPEAPIFEATDYYIEGDLYKIVPALTAALRQRTKLP
jgi:electron transfer flavoprotein alpha subunit